jgi:hypothetical protein
MIMKYVKACEAIQVNSVLTWLMVDQVGSTSVTSDINGALGDTVKYSALAVFTPPSVLCERGM